MTQLFKRNRIMGHAAVFLLSIAVLALAAHLGSLFLPNINRDFSTFAIVIPVLTLISLLILFGYTRPYIEVIFIFVLGVLWLAMASWSMDIIGHVQCSELGGQQTATKSGSISTKSYCYEMKIIEAFSWIIFTLLAIFFWILVALTNRAIVLGRPMAWREPIVDLPWFGQFPGTPMEHSAYGGYSPYMPGSPMGYPMQPGMMQPGMGYSQAANGGGYVVSQAPGHSVVIEPGSRGRGPTVRQVPGMPM